MHAHSHPLNLLMVLREERDDTKREISKSASGSQWLRAAGVGRHHVESLCPNTLTHTHTKTHAHSLTHSTGRFYYSVDQRGSRHSESRVSRHLSTGTSREEPGRPRDQSLS
ncbi:unnamed protein product [Boreogadus saida]